LVVVVMVFHGSFGEVAAVGDGPFVVDLDQDGAGEAQEGLGGWGRHRRRRCGV
jgi:adenylosuccinate synthase